MNDTIRKNNPPEVNVTDAEWETFLRVQGEMILTGRHESGRTTRELVSLPDAALINRSECARVLGTTVGTLSKWASDGQGPKFMTLGHGRFVRYKLGDVRAFVDAHIVNTVEPGSEVA